MVSLLARVRQHIELWLTHFDGLDLVYSQFSGDLRVVSLLGLHTGGKGSLNWGIHADYIVVF